MCPQEYSSLVRMFICLKPKAALQLFYKPRWEKNPTFYQHWILMPFPYVCPAQAYETQLLSVALSPLLNHPRIFSLRSSLRLLVFYVLQTFNFCELRTTENKCRGLQMVGAARLKQGGTLSLCCSAQTDERTDWLTDWLFDWLIDWFTLLISCMWNSSVR